MAAQLTQTSGCRDLELYRWICSATSSLPVPVSPVMRTWVSAAATLLMYVWIACMLELSPIMG